MLTPAPDAQIPGERRGRPRPRRRRRDGAAPLYDTPPRLDGQAPLRHHGLRQSRRHGRLRGRLAAQHGGASLPPSLPLANVSLLSPQRADALALVTAAVSAGIFNDLGSGSNVDACVITASHTEMLRNYVRPNERVQKERSYGFRRGTTAWKKEDIRNMVVNEDITFTGAEAMDTS